jgi:ketosteroid isomerase-like protein
MTDATTTILELDEARREAMVRADVAALAAVYADDVQYMHANFQLDDKATMLAEIGAGKPDYLTIATSDELVRFYGDVAVLTGIASMKVAVPEGTMDLRNRFTVIWVRQDDGGWQVVNSQSTSGTGLKPTANPG